MQCNRSEAQETSPLVFVVLRKGIQYLSEMDIENTYTVKSFQVTIGWSDENRQFYAELVDTSCPVDEKPTRDLLKTPTDCLRMLDWLSETLEQHTGVVEFYPPHHDIVKLMDAPLLQTQPLAVEDFLANPGQYMDATGTLYPDGRPATVAPFLQDRDIETAMEGPELSFERFLEFIESAPSLWTQDHNREDVRQEVTDAINELHSCVDILDGWQEAEDAGITSEIEGTLAERQSDILSRTAIHLIVKINPLSGILEPSEMTRFAAVSQADTLLSYEDLFSEEQRAAIDALTTSLCRAPLSGFPQAVARRYSPVDGRTFGTAPNASSPESLFPGPETERLYEQFMSAEEAAETARIQRRDPRDRREEDWAYLAERHKTLLNLSQRCERE